MKELRPNRTYACIRDITIPTVLFGEQKTVTLKNGCYYHVNYDGKLETHEGLAEMTEDIAECLVAYRSDDDIKRWADLRNQAAVQALSGIMANKEEMEKASKSYWRIQHEVAERAISYANTLVKKLIDTEDEWLQELKYI